MIVENERPAFTLWTALGLVLALSSPLIARLFDLQFDVYFDRAGSMIAGSGITLLLALILLLIVRFGEDRQILGTHDTRSSIGLNPMTRRLMLIAVILGFAVIPIIGGVAVQLAVWIIGEPTRPIIDPEGITFLSILIAIIVASTTEELFYRGYGIERLSEIIGNVWVAGFLTMIVFVGLHIPAHGLLHSIGFVLPGALLLTATYLWKRNLWMLMIAHFLINAPLLLIPVLM